MVTLALSALGGLVALDATSLGQFMVSRPLVAASLAGWLLGDPVQGLAVGFLLELFHLSGLPAGGSRVPEAGPASVAAVATAAVSEGPAGLALAVAVGLVVSALGGLTIGVQRHLNGNLIARVEADGATPEGVELAHLTALFLDFLRGALVTGVAVVGGMWVAESVGGRWPLGDEATLGLVLVGASVHLGVLFRGFGGWSSRHRVFLLGVVAGVVGVYLS